MNMIHYKNSYKFSIAFILTVILWLLIALPSASAATATEVWVNNVKLDSSAYYLANGSGTATTTKPASGGYAYFDAASGTLTLYNMQLDTLHTYATYDSLLFANGDLEIVLTGASTLQYNNSNIGTYMGIYVQGLLTISGSGSASIQFDSTALGTAVYGIYSHDMAIASGTLNVRTSGLYVTHGIVSYSDIYITGGNTTVQIDAIYAIGFLMQTGDFRMTGGTANATVSAEVDAIALITNDISLEGGTGTFSSTSYSTNSGGGQIYTGMWNVTGGHFVFSGPYSALLSNTVTYTVQTANVETYVADNVSGSNKSLWVSAADGILITTSLQKSPFLYVEFYEPPTYTYPQTGDGQTPLVWAGIALLVLSGVCLMIRRFTKRLTYR